MEYKHYIRTTIISQIPFITYGFCDAFEVVLQTDILTEESDIRQYNPQFFDAQGIPLYKWENGFVSLTEEDIIIWKATLPKPEPTDADRIALLQKAMNDLIMMGVKA